ncbi:MAG: dihydrodipicolinate synthase family protein [Bacteroidetes bacterium]|nr:dihydrodipicolinate synthase family protein [Bacteroidota bacterium]
MNKSKKEIKGYIAAVIAPMKENGDIFPERIVDLADYLISSGIDGLYVNGTTGEGPSLTLEERNEMTDSWCRAVKGRVPVIVHVGDNSLPAARRMARFAADAGADVVAALPPWYFKPATLELLVDWMKVIAGEAWDLPFYYYHLPGVTGVEFDMVRFMELALKEIPTFRGIKFSSLNIPECQACVDAGGDVANVFWGCDEAILTGFSIGCSGGVGSTYNFALPLYIKIRDAWAGGELEIARQLQSRAVDLVRICGKFGGQRAFKAMMKIIGMDSGPSRLPILTLSGKEMSELEMDVRKIGFFDWGVE